MKIRFLFIAFMFLLIPLISAYNIKLTLNSNIADFNTDVYKCADSGCSSISFYDSVNSGTKINTYSLIGSGDNHYAEYDYKSCYIPHIYINHAWGIYTNEKSFPITLNKKTDCKGHINSGELSKEKIKLGESVVISSNINSAFEYPKDIPKTTKIPSEIKSEYSSKIKASFYANDNLIYSEEKEILLENEENFEFEWAPEKAGTYEIVIKSEVTDCACLSQNIQTLNLGEVEVKCPECSDDNDCPEDVPLAPVCKNNDVFGNYIDYFCLDGLCKSEIKDFFVKDCGENYCGSFGENYCKSNNVYHSRACYNKGCLGGGCYEESYQDEKLVQICEYSCLNGSCVSEPVPVCGNGILEQGEECDDGNLENNDGCSSVCELEEIECCNDEDCQEDYYSERYCSEGDVYQDFHDFSCINRSCQENIIKQLAEKCGKDKVCRSGKCKEEDDGDDDRIDRDKRFKDDDVLFVSQIAQQGNYSSLEVIRIGPEKEAYKTDVFWVWFWIILIVILVLIGLILLASR